MQDRVYSRCSLDGKSLLSIVGFRRFAVGSSSRGDIFIGRFLIESLRFWKPSLAGAWVLARDAFRRRDSFLCDEEINDGADNLTPRASGSLLSDSYARPYMCNRVVNSEHGPRSSGSYSSSILSLLPVYTFFFLDDDFRVALRWDVSSSIRPRDRKWTRSNDKAIKLWNLQCRVNFFLESFVLWLCA